VVTVPHVSAFLAILRVVFNTEKHTNGQLFAHDIGQKLYTITKAQKKSYKNPIRLSTCARLKHYWPL